MINAIIVDDEYNAIKNLKWEVERFCPEIKIIDAFTDPKEAISAINYLKPDCVFLDIEMPEIDGFQLLNRLHFRAFDLIITTAYDNYAIKAFKEHAIDYLLKPIDSDDLIRAVDKIKKNKAKNELGFEIRHVLASLNDHSLNRIALPMAGKTMFVEPHEILYCQSDGNYSFVHLVNGKSFHLTKQLKELNEILKSPIFFRVHNSYIINLNQVKEFVKTDGSYLVMTNGVSVPISRSKKDMVQNLLNV